jgi:hypothetical protein
MILADEFNRLVHGAMMLTSQCREATHINARVNYDYAISKIEFKKVTLADESPALKSS